MTTEPSRRRPGRVRGIRSRLVVGAAALLAIAFALAGFAMREVLLLQVDDRIETNLAQESDELALLAAAVDPATGQPVYTGAETLLSAFLQRNVPSPSEAYYAFAAGRPLLASFDADPTVFDDTALAAEWTSATQPYRDDVVVGGRELRALITPLVDDAGTVLGTLVVTIDPADELEQIDSTLVSLAFIAVIVTALGTMAARGIAGRVLRPVHELTAAARSTGAGDLGTRIEVAGNDELTELGHTYNDMLDRLEQAFRGQREFLDDVAHELRTPITILRGHLEMLPDDPAQRAAAVSLLTDELDRMSRYVDDLLTVARAGRPDFLRVDLVDVADVVDGALDRARSVAPRRWERSVSPRPGEVLTEADGDRLVQAMLALVTNAVQHTSPDDRITIGATTTSATSTASTTATTSARTDAPVAAGTGASARTSGHAATPGAATPGTATMVADEPEDAHAAPAGTVVLWVADTGPGVDHADRTRLFERFSRGPASSERRPDGTGLGLAIVAAIAKAHGGTADVIDTPGGGATFRIHLPHRILEDHT